MVGLVSNAYPKLGRFDMAYESMTIAELNAEARRQGVQLEVLVKAYADARAG